MKEFWYHIEADFDERSTLRRLNLDATAACEYLHGFEVGMNRIEENTERAEGFVITSLGSARALRIYTSPQLIPRDIPELPLSHLRRARSDLAIRPLHVDELAHLRGEAQTGLIEPITSSRPREIVLVRSYQARGTHYDDLPRLTEAAIRDAEVYCERNGASIVTRHELFDAEHRTVSNNLPRTILEKLRYARMVIADWSQPSVNVHFEVGYAFGRQRVVHIGRHVDSRADLPLYLRAQQQFVWSSAEDYLKQLTARIADTLLGRHE